MSNVLPAGTTELIRRDLEPTLARLYAIYSYSEFGAATRSGYRGYVEDLYGGRKEDRWFVFLNYAALAAFIALIVSITWLIWA